ncbi:hypothetical protein [Methylosinus sp. LW3]|uniref:hypothetical protein n=1 Tax=Methylosinus sp. LW3 TaxID=107635 RepID=UPI000467C09E|nr:hypothetical protein [Methylosinus sp. LW3]
MSAAAILKLQASGFSVEQVSALAELVDTQAATKADVEAAKHELELKIGELKSDLEATEHRLDQKIDGVEHRLELKIGELKAGLELKVEGLDRKITEVNANTLKWVISAIGFQTLLMIGTVVGAVAALMKAIPQTPLTHP